MLFSCDVVLLLTVQGHCRKPLIVFNMKHLLILLTLQCAAITVTQAQTTEDSVKASINLLFEGMKNSDAGMIGRAFADSALLQTIARDRNGKTVVRNEPVASFMEAIGKLPKGAADERISFDLIKIDGPLAIAWTPYKFYYNGNFSHCGVNSFQLVRMEGVWKIQYIIDTRRRDNCE